MRYVISDFAFWNKVCLREVSDKPFSHKDLDSILETITNSEGDSARVAVVTN